MKTYLFTALLVAASSFAHAGTLETIPRGSKIEFNGSANIRPGITALYWQNGKMSDDFKSIQFGKFCTFSFEASGVDRALKPGVVFLIDSLRLQRDNSPELTLGRNNSSAKAKLSCFEKFVPPKKAITQESQPKEEFKGAQGLKISEFEKITGQDFKVILSPTIDFEPTFPKPIPGDQRKFDKRGFNGSIKLHRDLELKKQDSYRSEVLFVNGQLNASARDLDIVCSLSSSSPTVLKAGRVGATDNDGSYFMWFRGVGGLELVEFDCYRVKADSYDYEWNEAVGASDRDNNYRPTIAEIHKALGSIATLKVLKLN